MKQINTDKNRPLSLPARKQIRLTGYDYSLPGYYFVTVCTQERKNILGKIVNEEMKLNKYGEIFKNEWLKTPQIRKYIDLDEFQIMPNHLHAIIIINNSVGVYCHTPANKKQTTNTGLCNKPLQKPWYQSPSIGLGAIIRGFKSATAKQINRLRNTPQQSVWQRGFYEHIIRNETELAKIQEYINLNPLMWLKDEDNLERPKIKNQNYGRN